MKKLEQLFDKIRPLFAKGGRWERFHPLFEANESFLFTPDRLTASAPHVRDPADFKRIMITVVIALMPCTLFGAYNVGYQAYHAQGLSGGHIDYFLSGITVVLPIILVSFAVGGAWETLFAVVRKYEINEGFLVTGLLFPLTLPPTIPLWQVAVAVSFGVVIGKEVFGGTGMNILNPALLARAFIFFAYPSAISGDHVWIFSDNNFITALLPWMHHFNNAGIDAVTQATPLAVVAAGPAGGAATEIFASHGVSWWNQVTGFVPGSIGETSVIANLLGAAMLLGAGVASVRIMLSMVLGLVGITLLFNLLAGDGSSAFMTMPPHWHLVVGGFALGTVFMATDPVSASNTDTGRWIYGAMIGILTGIIRVTNPAYVEGTMLAILFMNVFAPLIDHFVVGANIRRRRALYER